MECNVSRKTNREEQVEDEELCSMNIPCLFISETNVQQDPVEIYRNNCAEKQGGPKIVMSSQYISSSLVVLADRESQEEQRIRESHSCTCNCFYQDLSKTLSSEIAAGKSHY